MAWIGIAVVVILSFLEIGNTLLLVSSFGIERKRGTFAIDLPVYIITGGVMVAINYFESPKIFLILCYAAMVIKVYHSYYVTILESLVYFILAIVSAGVLELILYIPVNLLFGKMITDKEVAVIVVLLLLCISNWLRRKRGLMFVGKVIKKQETNITIMFLIAVSIVVGAFFCFNVNRDMGFLEGLYLMLAAGVLIYTTCRISLYRYEIKLQKEYAKSYESVIETVRSRQHKFMNQIDAIYSLFAVCDNYDDLVRMQSEELDKVQQYLMPNKILILENPIVVAHIYQEMCRAKDIGVDLRLNLSCSLKVIDVPDVYLIEIIGNILDNAIDAVLERGLQEAVYLSIYQEDKAVCIHVCNEHDKIPHSEYSKFFLSGYSSKGDERGLGLPYVKKIVNKYKGIIEIGNLEVEQKNCFSVKVSLPI